tara:strand:- start:2422 stop:3798 length:1377 start_codon:yes stop_codon:yes gene_type:complete
MSKIILHVRPWNNQFMLNLAEQLINLNGYDEVVFLTMFSECNDFFKNKKRNIILLPELIDDVIIDEKRLEQIDDLLFKDNVCLNDILETERFYSKNSYDEKYFYQFALLLDKIIDKNTLNISLTLDHFVYSFSARLTNVKKGLNYAFIPVGVPYNSVVALRDSWNVRVNKINQRKIKKNSLKDRLNRPSSERLVYMQKVKKPNIFNSHSKRVIKYLKKDFKIKNYLNDVGFSWSEKIYKKIFSGIKKNYHTSSLNTLSNHLNKKFVYIPLHLEPEATVILYSTYFQNQIEMARIIAKVLPYGWEIIVKENPKMMGIRNKEFYKTFNELPNVRFISQSIESSELIKKSQIVVSLSGTASLEAYLLDKPAILFGTPPHHKLLKYSGYGVNFLISDLYEIFRSKLKLSDFYNDLEWDNYVAATLPFNMIPKRNNIDQLRLDLEENPPEYFSSFIRETLSNE